MHTTDLNNLELAHPKALAFKTDQVAVLGFCSALGLKPFLDYFENNNTSADLPYHNTRHAYGVAASCITLLNTLQYAITRRDQAALFLAALFHDFNHSAGRSTDYENVRNSAAGLRQAHEACPGLVADHVITLATTLILSTEYPYAQAPTTMLEGVLRDADLMQAFKSDGVDVIMEGLRMEIQKSSGNEVSRIEMYKRQRAFLKAVEFHTPHAIALSWALTDAVLSAFYFRAYGE